MMPKQGTSLDSSNRYGQIGVIGLGIMGLAISENLIRHGHKVVGFDLNSTRSLLAKKRGIDVQSNAVAVAEKSSIILLSLPDSEALDSVVTELIDAGNGRFSGHILVELSTLDLQCKSENRDRLREIKVSLLDCPVSGTGAQAVSGDIALYSSGNFESHQTCLPVFQDFSASVHFLGDFGHGTKMKYVANLLVAIHNVATAEAMVLGKQCGLDPKLLIEVIGAGAGSSKIFELRSSLMAEGRFSPPTMKLDVWQKDMSLIAEFAARAGVTTPLFSATAPIYDAAIRGGLDQQDTAAVYTILEQMVRHDACAPEA